MWDADGGRDNVVLPFHQKAMTWRGGGMSIKVPGEPWVGMPPGAAAVGHHMEVPQTFKSRSAIQPSICTSGCVSWQKTKTRF